jgi:hypothetical protein
MGKSWMNQPRDPGGKDGGRWIKAGGRDGDTSGRFGKRNLTGKGNQRTLAGKRLADVRKATFNNEDAKDSLRTARLLGGKQSGRHQAAFNRANEGLRKANERAYGTGFGRGRNPVTMKMTMRNANVPRPGARRSPLAEARYQEKMAWVRGLQRGPLTDNTLWPS